MVALKLPLIWESPVSTLRICGAEITWLSRTTATRQRPSSPSAAGSQALSVLLYASRVSSVHFFWPSLVKLRLTTHWLVWSIWAVALLTSVPSTLAASRRYLAVLSQATTWRPGP